MAKTRKNTIAERPLYRILLTVISAVLSAFVITFSSLILVNIANKDLTNIHAFLLGMFISLGLMSIVIFLKNRTKVNLIRCLLLLIVDVTLGIISLFAKENSFLIVLTAGIYCFAIAVSRIFDLIQNHTPRGIIINALIILFLVLFAIGIFTSGSGDNVESVLLIECIFIALVSFVEAMSVALAQLKVKILIKIIVSTFSLEILFGLLIMVVAFSFALVAVEPAIESYPDALWYCFAVITTIGFGDIAAATPIGRILTVILGLYGLVVVAVITSIIVNFYNETQGKRDQKEFKEIKKDDGQM